MKRYGLAVMMATGIALVGCGAQDSAVELETPAQKASYGMGLDMGRALADEGMNDLDPQAVALGIQDALDERESRVTKEDLTSAFSALQERALARKARLSEENAQAGLKFLEENGKREGVITTDSGLQYEILKSADGPQPAADDVVTVHYEGKLLDGSVFDGSVAPLDLPVGQVIAGWVEALQLMNVGGKYRLYVPSDLAYGEYSPSPAIPANSTLIFDIELLGIQEKPSVETGEEVETE